MIFVDTSFLFALINEGEAHHQDAAAIQRQVDGAALTTTNHVLGESWTLTNRRLGHRAATQLVNAVRASARYTILHVAEEVEAHALRWLLRHDEREYSFVDATSFETMREHGIDAALAFDRDFEAAGFRTLRA